MNVQNQSLVKMTERRSLASTTRPMRDEPVSERRADAPAPYQGFDGQCINGSWRPGRHGGVQIDTNPYSAVTLAETIMANQSDLDEAAGPAPPPTGGGGQMALVYNGFSTYRLFAASLTAARLNAGLTEAARRLSESRWLTSTNGLRDSEHRSSWSRQSPGSVFDARYKGLTSHAARLDAAICRHEYLR